MILGSYYDVHNHKWYSEAYIHMSNSRQFDCSKVRQFEVLHKKAVWKSISDTPVRCYQLPITVNEWWRQTNQKKNYQILRGIYKLETQRMANRVPINSVAKHIEHNGEVHWRDVTFQRLGFTNNETQRRPGVQLLGHDWPTALYTRCVSSLYIPLRSNPSAEEEWAHVLKAFLL